MLNNILVSYKFPKLWHKSKVITILKPSKDSSLPKSYRPISLLCHTYGLLDRMILNRLKPITEDTTIKEQSGFRAGKSCTSQLLNLTQYIEDGYEKSLTTGTEDAEFTKLIESMMSNRRFYVKQALSEEWFTSRECSFTRAIQFLYKRPACTQWDMWLYLCWQTVYSHTTCYVWAAETILTATLQNQGKYYENNNLRTNPDKTQTCAFHLKNREANRKLNIT